ncbi:M56 family metallopeptidase [Lachnospiraceae bacterium ZAX-1]
MSISIFSFVMSVLWCDIFVVASYLLRQRNGFLIHFSIYPILLLMLASLSRLLFSLEFPFAVILHSDTVFPAIVTFFNTTLFAPLSGTVNITVATAFLAIWVIGCCYSFFRIFFQHTRFQKTMSQEQATQEKKIYSILGRITGECRLGGKTRVIQTSLVSTPMVTGFFKPTIYLPDMPFSDDEMYYILLHEWTHFLHKDLWLKLLVQIICAIYWWNPIIYILKHNLDQTLEIKSDLDMAGRMPEESKIQYLKTILKVARNTNGRGQAPAPHTALQFVANNRREWMKQRFYMVLESEPQKPSQKPTVPLFHIFTITLFAISYLFVIQPRFKPPSQENGTLIYDINPDNAYLIDNADTTYSLYIDGQFLLDTDDITSEPYSTLPIQ